MSNALTKEERAVCVATRTSEAEYFAQRAKNRGIAAFSATTPVTAEPLRPVMEQLGEYLVTRNEAYLRAARTRLAPVIDGLARRFLTAADIAVCRQMGSSLAEFAINKSDRMSGRTSVATHAPPYDRNGTRPSRSDYADSVKASNEMTAADWLKAAIEEITKFLKDPEHLESLQFLIAADRWIDNAMRAAGARRAAAGSY